MASVKTPADALKRAVYALVRAALPRIDYYAFYRAEVVAQSADRSTVDVKPRDPRVPPMGKVPLKLGIPATTVELRPGAVVLVGWEDGDPQHPQAALFKQGASVVTISISSDKVELGGQGLKALLEEVVIGQTTCQFTGAMHHIVGNTSKKVLAKG